MTASRYETLPIETLERIVDRLTVALDRTNLANRDQVRTWRTEALLALTAAYGWVA